MISLPTILYAGLIVGSLLVAVSVAAVQSRLATYLGLGIIVVSFSLFYGLRAAVLYSDTYYYYSFYSSLSTFSQITDLSAAGSAGLLLNFLFFVLSSLGAPFQIVLLLISAASVILLSSGLVRILAAAGLPTFTHLIAITIVLSLPTTTALFGNLMPQGLATALAILSLSLCINRSRCSAIAILLLASLTHISALTVLPVLFLVQPTEGKATVVHPTLLIVGLLITGSYFDWFALFTGVPVFGPILDVYAGSESTMLVPRLSALLAAAVLAIIAVHLADNSFLRWTTAAFLWLLIIPVASVDNYPIIAGRTLYYAACLAPAVFVIIINSISDIRLGYMLACTAGLVAGTGTILYSSTLHALKLII